MTVKSGPGFHPGEMFEVYTFNLFARIIGFIMRGAVIIFGLLLVPVLFFVFSLPPVIWIISPFLTLPLYLGKSPDENSLGKYLVKRSGKSLKKLAILTLKSNEGQFVARHLDLDPVNLLLYLENQENCGMDIIPATYFKSVNRIRISDILLFLGGNYPPLGSLLENNKIQPDDVYGCALWYEKLHTPANKPLIVDLTRIKQIAGIGYTWAYGYTPMLDKYTQDLTKVLRLYPNLFGRDRIIFQFQEILSRNENNNVLLVGEKGVGKKILVETLADRIQTGSCIPQLAHKRILVLDINSVITALPTILEAKGFLTYLLTEAEFAGNVILVVEDFERYLNQTNGTDLTDFFIGLCRSGTGFIAITTPAGERNFVDANPDLRNSLGKLEIPVPDKKTVLFDLEQSIAPTLEKKYGITVSRKAILKVIDDSDRYITSIPYPAKAVELLDNACVYMLSHARSRTLTDAMVDEFLSDKFHTAIGALQNSEKDKLVHMEELLHARIINQNEAIHTISAALRRARLEINNTNKPLGSFLFLGPTGMGKTETAKALASVYFGSQNRLVRFDMSDYQSSEGLERLIGSVKSKNTGELTTKLNDNPFSLVLFDEIEKSPLTIRNLLLTLLDEGFITDALGNKISGKNSIIIATSNAGAEVIREKRKTGLTPSKLKKELLDDILKEKIFSPELLNRFDAVVVFSPLSEGHLREVAKLMMDDLNSRLKPKNISVKVTPVLIRKLAREGFDPDFGARAMKRLITDTIEDQIAQKILAGDYVKGEKIEVEI